jgi:hypothetical protein
MLNVALVVHIDQTAHKKQEPAAAAAADGVVELGQDGSFDAAASPDAKAATTTAVTTDAAPAAEPAAATAAKAPVSTAGAADSAGSDKPRKFLLRIIHTTTMH